MHRLTALFATSTIWLTFAAPAHASIPTPMPEPSAWSLLAIGVVAAVGVRGLVAIVCDRHLRYARLAQRPERPLTPVEAEQRDYGEIENLEKGGPIAIADYTLLNNADEASLLRQLDTLTTQLGF